MLDRRTDYILCFLRFHASKFCGQASRLSRVETIIMTAALPRQKEVMTNIFKIHIFT